MEVDEKTLAYFDKHTPEYSLGRYQTAIEFIRSTETSDASVVDFGCGAGNILDYVRQNTGIRNLCGVDIAPNYVASVRQRLGCGAYVGSVLDDRFVATLPRFDYAILGAVLHHLVDDNRANSKNNAERALANALSVLKPTGSLIIIEPVFAPVLALDVLFYLKKYISRLSNRRVSFFNTWNNIGAPVVSYLTERELQQMCSRHCESVTTHVDENPVPLLWKLAGISRKANLVLVLSRRNAMMGRAA